MVDDEPGVEMIFSKILGERGHAVRYFPNAEEALAYLGGEPGSRILFLDIRLPGMDGITALSKFIEINPSLQVIMMTAYQTVESVVNAMRIGAVDYLVKPLNPAMLLQAVDKYDSPSGPFPRSLSLEKPAAPAPGGAAAATADAGDFIASTPLMKETLSVAGKFAASDGNVLILGESGTGKELLAHYIHRKSDRAGKPMVVVDCTSIPESLFESELFGYDKGAFTGADAAKAGRFELADGGSLFLDEIGNLPLAMQAKLLRFTQDHTVTRLGAKRPQVLDVRLIAATNVDLKKSVEKGVFREDLYYRISALAIHLPPLRNRSREEKDVLVEHFLALHARKLKKNKPTVSAAASGLIADYPWPGNVREMENALYSATLLCGSGSLEVQHFPVGIQSYFSYRDSRPAPAGEGKEKTLKEILKKVEKEQIFSTLKQTGGNKKKASELLDMDYKSFLSKLKEYSGKEEDNA